MIALLILVVGSQGCGPTGSGGEPPALSSFRTSTALSGLVLENVRLCEVDAGCYLRIEFSDTTITALYGTGERARPPCEISVETSNLAFGAEPGRRGSTGNRTVNRTVTRVVISPEGIATAAWRAV